MERAKARFSCDLGESQVPLADQLPRALDALKDAAARLLHDVGIMLVNKSKNGKVLNN